MDIRDFIKNRIGILAFSGSLRSNYIGELALKLYLIECLISKYKLNSTISIKELVTIAEELSVPFQEEDIVRILESTGIVDNIGYESFKIREKIPLHFIFDDIQPRSECNIDEYTKIIEKIYSPLKSSTIVSLKSCISAVYQSYDWVFEITKNCEERKQKGIPTFFHCKNVGEHPPLGITPAAFATFDCINTLLEPILYGYKPDYLIEESKLHLLDTLFQYGLSFQDNSNLWDEGGIHPGQDLIKSDFPTVGSTGVAVLGLRLLLTLKGISTNSQNQHFDPSKELISKSINSAIRFLLRMQKDDGSWGIYRYEDDKYPTPSDVYSCQQGLIALSNAKSTNLLSGQEVQMKDAVNSCLDFIVRNAQANDNTIYWTSDFLNNSIGLNETITSTARIIQGMMISCFAWKENIPQVANIMEKGIKYVLDLWVPDPASLFITYIRVPQKSGPSKEFVAWETPVDPIVVSVILEYSREFNFELHDKEWWKIDTAISNFLATQKHGHWNNPHSDPNFQWPFPSHTYFYTRALSLYIWNLFHKEKTLFI